MFWCSYFQESLRKLRTSLKSRTSSSQASSSNALNNFHSLFALPVSVVTTVEASDWSVQVRLDAVSLQSKEPVCRAVMAACAANVQWSPVKDETTTIRYMYMLHLDSKLTVGLHKINFWLYSEVK